MNETSSTEDPVQALVHSIGECRRWARDVGERITSLESGFKAIEPGLARDLARIQKRLSDLDPEFTLLLDFLEGASDPSRWFCRQPGATRQEEDP